MPLRATNSRLERVVQRRRASRAVVVLDQRVERGLHGRHARVAVLVDAVTEAHDLALLGERRGRATGPTFSAVPISSKMCMTASFAPPCSGPLSAPIAPTTAEYRSAERRA